MPRGVHHVRAVRSVKSFFCSECPLWTKLLHCEYEHAPEPTVTVKRSIRTPKDTNHGMKSMETGLLSEGIDHLGVLHQQVWACRIVLSVVLSVLLSCLKTACVCVSTVPYWYRTDTCT